MYIFSPHSPFHTGSIPPPIFQTSKHLRRDRSLGSWSWAAARSDVSDYILIWVVKHVFTRECRWGCPQSRSWINTVTNSAVPKAIHTYMLGKGTVYPTASTPLRFQSCFKTSCALTEISWTHHKSGPSTWLLSHYQNRLDREYLAICQPCSTTFCILALKWKDLMM